MTLSLSFVLMTWNRSETLLNNSLYTLSNQTVPPLEIIVVEVSPESSYHVATQELCAKYPLVRLVEGRWSHFNISRGLNVGIKQAKGQYIATGLMEVFYGRNLLETIQPKLGPHRATSGKCGSLGPEVDTSLGPEHAWANWESLCSQVNPHLEYSPNAFMCVECSWWFYVRGYDEARRPYSYQDTDITDRAFKTGLIKGSRWGALGEYSATWAEAQMLHPWHPQSPLFYSVNGYLIDPVIDACPVRNLSGWGEIEGDELERIWRR